MYTLEGVSSVANFITAYDSHFLICSMFFVSKGNLGGWSGGAKVSCIMRHWGVQLILAYS